MNFPGLFGSGLPGGSGGVCTGSIDGAGWSGGGGRPAGLPVSPPAIGMPISAPWLFPPLPGSRAGRRC